MLLLDLHTDFLGGRSGGLVFPSLEEFSTVCCHPHNNTVKGFSVVSEAKVNVFVEFSWFFDDPEDVGILISGSSLVEHPEVHGSRIAEAWLGEF